MNHVVVPFSPSLSTMTSQDSPAQSPKWTPGAELILTYGQVVRVDRNFTLREAFSLKDGKIITCGKEKGVKATAGPATRVIDTSGKTFMTDLQDAHLHFHDGISCPAGVNSYE